MLQGCTIRENSLVGIGAIIVNKAVIGRNCLIGAGALVPEGKTIPDSLVLGVPGKSCAASRPQEIAMNTWIAEYRRALRRARGALPAGPQAPGMIASRYRGSLAVWALLIAYASLYPFVPLRLPSMEEVGAFFVRKGYATGFDVALNILAYVPLGTLARLYFRQAEPGVKAILKAVGIGAALSFAMESSQRFVPYRVASIYDLAANAGGALWGAMFFADPFYSLVTGPLGELCERIVIPGAWGDAALVLVMLWLIAQLNPALRFFGAGNIVGNEAMVEFAFLQWSAVAMSICGFGLFVSTFLKGEQGTLRVALLLLSVALCLKFMAASFMLQPHFAEEWLSVGRVAGLMAGVVALAPLRRVARAGRRRRNGLGAEARRSPSWSDRPPHHHEHRRWHGDADETPTTNIRDVIPFPRSFDQTRLRRLIIL